MSSLFQINNLYKNSQGNVNKEIGQWISNNNLKESINIITIPVVVHVIWEDNTDENISDTQILSQIEILNKDFRRTNIDVINTPSVWNSIAADCEIEFCLASIDPYGNAWILSAGTAMYCGAGVGSSRKADAGEDCGSCAHVGPQTVAPCTAVTCGDSNPPTSLAAATSIGGGTSVEAKIKVGLSGWLAGRATPDPDGFRRGCLGD